MDYEEYKRKALEPIVNYIESAMASYSKEELEARIKKALPKKESEDERIRKMLIEQMERWKKCAEDNNVEQDVKDASDAIAYLEKQKEQKPVEWSEEDKAHIESLLKRLDGMCKKGATFTQTRFAVSEDMDWLKDLRPWKPNVEKLYYDRANKEFYVKETINDPKSAIQELYKRLNKQ
jgi:hypothetical protein